MLIALKKNEPEITWKPGQILIGDSRWGCSNNANNPASMTIYTKITAANRTKEYVMELQTAAAG